MAKLNVAQAQREALRLKHWKALNDKVGARLQKRAKLLDKKLEEQSHQECGLMAAARDFQENCPHPGVKEHFIEASVRDKIKVYPVRCDLCGSKNCASDLGL